MKYIINNTTGNKLYVDEEAFPSARYADYREVTQEELQAYEQEKITNLRKMEAQAEIDILEKSQLRSLREMVVEPNDSARNKLIEINNKIKELRKELAD